MVGKPVTKAASNGMYLRERKKNNNTTTELNLVVDCILLSFYT